MIARALGVLHRFAYLAYPREFRAHFGAELSDIYERRIAQARARGRLRAAVLALWLSADAVATGLSMRRERRAFHSTSRRKASSVVPGGSAKSDSMGLVRARRTLAAGFA